MYRFNHGSRLRTIWNTRRRNRLMVAMALMPLFALLAVWGWYANAGEVTGQNNDPTPRSGDPLATAPAGETNAVAALGASPAPSASSSSARFSSISVGHDHACGVLASGGVVCWGRNDVGQATPPDGEFKSVNASDRWSSCGIRADDTVACWGRSIAGTPEDTTFRSVSVDDGTACGITLAGSIMCWSNDPTYRAPVGGPFQQVSVGFGHACALSTDGALVCWGRNEHGQSTPPSGTFQSVSAGDVQTCGLRTDGTAACWGSNWHGRSSPPPGTYQHVSTLWDHSCGVRTDGSIVCWGFDGHIYGLQVTTAPGGNDFQTVETGTGHSCALKTNGTVVCWGVDHVSRTGPAGVTQYQPPAPPVSNIAVCSGSAGEVVISWDAEPRATHYRIGYVNMAKDYPRAKASVTGEWIEAFTYIDVNALNILVSNGRAQYILRRLVEGDRHAFTVLTSNDVVNTTQTFSGAYYWPQNPRWRFLTVADPGTDCGDATASAPIPTPTAPTPTAPPPATTGDYDIDNDGLIEIADLVQLDAVRYDLDGDGSSSNRLYTDAFPEPLTGMGCPSSGCLGYELTKDLDFNLSDANAYWRDSRGWSPIGDAGAESGFDAIFDGNGHTIRNLFINWPATDYVGIFRTTTTDSAVRNLSLEAVSVTGSSHVGALVGLNRGSVANVSVSGNVAANADNAGGLTGANNGNISASSASARVSAQGSRAGGLSGATGQTITGSFATGQVSSEDRAGGLVGLANNATITGSYATGSVSAKNRVGGLIGEANGATLTGTYATGSATGNYTTYQTRGKRTRSRDGQFVGGLVGHATQTSITASYATTTVRGAEQVAGLVGSAQEGFIRNCYAAGNVWYPTSTAWNGLNGSGGGFLGAQERLTSNGSYWDTQSTGQSRSTAGIGKTTVELQTPTANSGIYANWNPGWWDFGTPRQYPALKYGGLDVARQRG